MSGNRDRIEPEYLPPAPAEGLDPMAVTTEVISIAQKMKQDAERALNIDSGYTTYTPLYYIKDGETDYCIRVEVDNGQLMDVSGKYVGGTVMRVAARLVTKTDQMKF